MVCPHKTIITKTEEKKDTTSSKTVVTTTFGKCERANCPYFVLLTETCLLGRGHNK